MIMLLYGIYLVYYTIIFIQERMRMMHRKKTKSEIKNTIIIVIIAVFVLIPLTAYAYSALISVNEEESLYYYDKGVKVKLPGAEEIRKKIDSMDPISGLPSYSYDYITLEKAQEQISLDFKYDGIDTILTYSVVREGERIIPIYKPGTVNGENNPLTAIGTSNKYILPYNMTFYLIDFDKLSITKFLPDETDGITFAEQKIQGRSWAVKPNISADGNLLVYQTARRDGYSDLRLYNFKTGEDRVIATGYGFNGSLVWNGNKSIFIGYKNKTYEVSLYGNENVTYIEGCDYDVHWIGYYPNILMNNKDGGITWYDCSKQTVKNLDILNLTKISFHIRLNKSDKIPAAYVMQDNDECTSITLLSFNDSALNEVFILKKPFVPNLTQWADESIIILSGTEGGTEKTYEIDVSGVLK